MTTIVLISHDLAPGGVQRKIADVARCLTRPGEPVDATEGRTRGYSVHLLLQEGPPPDPDARALFNSVESSVVRIRCRPRPRGGFLNVPFSLFCFWYVLTLRPQRIIGFLRGPGILAVVLRRLFWWRPVRVGISDDSFPSGAIVEQSRGAAHAALLRRFVHAAYSRADWVATPSEAARTDLVRTFKVPVERVIVSRNWVGSAGSEGPPPATTPSATAGPATIPDGGFDLIYVGRLALVKNLSLFVQIVRDLRGVRPSVRAVIVGGGPELPDLERQRSRFGLEEHLAFAGWQRDVTQWLATSRLFCITSHHEGLPIAALEAMASGLPVISTRYPGADELVRDGETGFLCRDRGEFVDRIVRCLTQESLRRDLGRRARELVVTQYGQDNLRRFAQLVVRG
jgi:glycosyltransferase involved in cell wall biosynthesis